jgi:hypothetical protein
LLARVPAVVVPGWNPKSDAKQEMSSEFKTARRFDATLMIKMWQLAEDVPLNLALENGIVVLCPECRIAHLGIRFVKPHLRDFCSSECVEKSKLAYHAGN